MTDLQTVKEKYDTLQAESPDLYHFLNGFRDWFNGAVQNYEVYLEDNWFEDKTTIEYILKSSDTFNIQVLAEDEYENYRDNIWNLGNYVTTYWLVEQPWEVIEQFISENTPLKLKS
jgi:hypothetical protein